MTGVQTCALPILWLNGSDVTSVELKSLRQQVALVPQEGFLFTATLADNKQQPVGGLLYRRGQELVIVPTAEKLSGTLLARVAAPVVLLTVPAGALPAGQYRVTVAGSRTARSWALQVH